MEIPNNKKITISYYVGNLIHVYCLFPGNYCEPPQELEHGKVLGTDHSSGGQISFRCDLGYRLVGAESTTCQPNKQWDMAFPSCEGMVEIMPFLSDLPVLGYQMTSSNHYITSKRIHLCIL